MNTIERTWALGLIVESLRNIATDCAEVAVALASPAGADLTLQTRILGRLTDEMAEAHEALREAGQL